MPHEFRIGIAEIDAVLIEGVGDVEAAYVEDELHSDGAARYVMTRRWMPLEQRDLAEFLADERLKPFVGAGPRRGEFVILLPAADRSRGVDGVPADRQLIELPVTHLHLDTVEVQDDGALGIPVPVLDKSHQREPSQTPATKRGQARSVFLADGFKPDEEGRRERLGGIGTGRASWVRESWTAPCQSVSSFGSVACSRRAFRRCRTCSCAGL
ncbi:hypothetical protein [Nonomuraea lactucae]|uniref:hypothetical protein n=1 Tax=Nonomuraea lactucae TaxID=2249762 RepID=UPI0013B3D538|nr:hypothetical protein [Nonomuraea lactucae]